MDEYAFEWDEQKRLSNLAKHGIDFRDVPSAFQHPYLEDYDHRHSSLQEQRWKVLGIVKIRVVLFVYKERDGNKRIITARPATTTESMVYYRRFWFEPWR
jgi:uncharacterized DUF497 family protein